MSRFLQGEERREAAGAQPGPGALAVGTEGAAADSLEAGLGRATVPPPRASGRNSGPLPP